MHDERGGEQQVQCAVDVRLMRGERVLDRAGYAGQRCLVEDEVDALAGGLHSSDVLQIHLLEIDLVADAGEVVERAGGEVVDAAHLVSLLDQRVGQG